MAGHSELSATAMAGWPRWQPTLEKVVAARGEASKPGRCAKARRSYGHEESNDGVASVMNFGWWKEVAGGKREEEKGKMMMAWAFIGKDVTSPCDSSCL